MTIKEYTKACVDFREWYLSDANEDGYRDYVTDGDSWFVSKDGFDGLDVTWVVDCESRYEVQRMAPERFVECINEMLCDAADDADDGVVDVSYIDTLIELTR